ncbi:RNA-directed DNA polymerase, eukaryota, reverse transcriptase zinc-binding domain protein [Tanacetum coccineum]
MVWRATFLMKMDMEFKIGVWNIRVEDICSFGLHFTWTKNLHKAKVGIMTGVLKKLDRIMFNEGFIKDFPQALAKFLPYIISDHTPVILCIPSNLKKKIKAFSKGNLFKRVECLRKQLQDIQISIDADPFDQSLWWRNSVKLKVIRKFFLHQQAMIKWLCDGDKNSIYFHRVLKGRNNKSKVFSLSDNDGNSYNYDQIRQLFLKHFENFLGSTYPVQEIESSETLFKEKLSTVDATKMISDISDSELKEIYLTLRIQKPMVLMVSLQLSLSKLGVLLVLILVLTNRIKPFLGKLISCNQSAFILGRRIQDNILLTQEIMRGYNRKGGPKRVDFKIDIYKAYDTVNWEFLKKVLKGFGFHEKMVIWIMQCVTTVTFTLNVNGDRIGYFKGGRGLRQGDPISPYLFTLIMEIFSLILLREINHEPNLQYHFRCKDIKLSHVCFADDLLFMCHGDATSVGVIKKALDAFSACSGLVPNNSKSTAFFRSMNEEESNAISVTPSNLSMQRNVEYPKALHYWVNSTRSENDY